MTDVRTKQCSRCLEVKPWSEYTMRGKSRGGESRPQAFCRKCGVARVQAWKAKHPERYAALKNGTLQKRRAAKVALVGREPHACDICGVLFVGSHHDAGHYDHNHATGEPRGWLCTKCNVGIGSLGDNPKIVERALKYLLERGYAQSRPVIR